MKFLRRPTEIEAIRYDGTNREAISDWLNATDEGVAKFKLSEVKVLEDVYLRIEMLEDVYLRIEMLDEVYFATPGDWVVLDEEDGFGVWKPDAFAATYMPAEESTPCPAPPPSPPTVPLSTAPPASSW